MSIEEESIDGPEEREEDQTLNADALIRLLSGPGGPHAFSYFFI